MAANSRDFLPLKDLVFRVLIALSEGERHGWALVQALDEPSGGTRLLPGHLYRTLNGMLDDGLIAERDEALRAERTEALRAERTEAPRAERTEVARAETPPAGRKGGPAPSRFFRLTPLGVAVARAETDRLDALVARSRAGRLLKARR